MTRLRPLLPLLFAVLAAHAHAQDARVKRIAVYVEPYYAAAREPGGTPRVNVSTALDRVLASNDAGDILRARDAILQEPANITPMTMMVLAIRLYDVGKRDDAVFWFYAARNRFLTTARVANLKAPALGNVEDAMKNFIYLAGPVINGYAFCDIENQKSIAKNALKWTIDHPYTALLKPEVPALPGDRKENFRKAFNELMDGLAKEEAWLESMPNVEGLKKQRRENGADVKYCWRS